jgi:hypothetical protein
VLCLAILIFHCFIHFCTIGNKRAGLISALVDLHKTQCFFSLSISTAIFAIVYAGTIGAWTLQSLWNTYMMMREVALCGVVPVVIIFFQLEISGQLEESWYMILLTCFTIIVAGLAAIWPYDVASGFTSLTTHTPLAMQWCSSHHPAMMCLDNSTARYTGMGFNSWTITIVSLCGLVCAGVLFRHVMISAHMITRLSPANAQARYTRTITTAVIVVLGLPLARYMAYLAMMSKLVNTGDWGFGQIVALTLWVPSLIELVAVLGKF